MLIILLYNKILYDIVYRFVHARHGPRRMHSYLSVKDRFEIPWSEVVNKTDTVTQYNNVINRKTPENSFCCIVVVECRYTSAVFIE